MMSGQQKLIVLTRPVVIIAVNKIYIWQVILLRRDHVNNDIISLFAWSRHNCLVIVTSSAIDYDSISRTKTEWVRYGDNVQRCRDPTLLYIAIVKQLVQANNNVNVKALHALLLWYFPLMVINNNTSNWFIALRWRHNESDGGSNHIKNIKAPLHWFLWEESTADRRIPFIKGQWRGKCFYLMTSPWFNAV